MNELLQQLRDARLHASAGEMGEAEGHIDEALELLDDVLAQRAGPKVSVRAVRGYYLTETRVAIEKADSRLAVSALDEAIRALEQ